MSITREQILDAIAEMSITEVVKLIEEMEEKFNVTAAVAVAAPAGGAAAGGEAAEEQTEFDVILKAAGANKVSTIKVVRAITGLGLKEAKELVEGAPKPVKESVSKADADDLKKQLEEAGAEVEIK